MSKYSLINCYSDNNKGDLGIILSTIDYIRNNDADARIKGISTYNYADPSFHSEHVILKQNIEVLPSIFGELNIGKNKSPFIKLVRFLWDTLRILILLIIPMRLSSKFLFSRNEKKTLRILRESDYIVSKGGSFICNDKNIRSNIALIRFLFIFILSFRLNKKVIILNQSIGPVYGNFSRKMVNYILQKCNKIVLREKKCVEEYQYLNYPNDTIINNDIAFYLKSKKNSFSFPKTPLNIGITIKFVDKEKEVDYQNMWVKFIEHTLEKYQNSNIIIFNQVPIDRDLEASWIIYKRINDIYKERIYFFTNDYESSILKYFYGQMDFFVGTRLHSTIFAMGELVPTISIAYHGTKADGIFENMQISELVIKKYSDDLLIQKFSKLYENKIYYQNILNKKLLEYKERMKADFKNIFDDK